MTLTKRSTIQQSDEPRRVELRMAPTDICQSVLASFFVRTALGEYELDTPAQLLSLLTTITRNKLANQAHRLRAKRRDIRRDAAFGSDHAAR